MDKGLVEVNYKMYSVSNVRNLVIISHIAGHKAEMLVRDLLLLVIRILIIMIVHLWFTIKRLVTMFGILQFGCLKVALPII